MKCLTNYFREKVLLLLNEKINLELTLDTFKKILLLPYKNYRNKTTGDLVTRLLDISLVKDNLTRIFLTLIIDLPLALSAMIILFLIQEKLFLISIIILILYIINLFIFKDYFDNAIIKMKKDNVSATNYMIESINNFETIKGLNISNRIYHQFENKFISLLNNSFKYESNIYLQKFLKDLIDECGTIIIFGIGSIMILDGNLSFGSLLTFGALLNYFFEPIKNIINLEKSFRELNLILKRMGEINAPSDLEGIICSGNIVFNHLNYSYDDKTNILNDISFDIKNGEKVILLGTSGSGKSTLVKLLMKYYETSRNMIKINDIDINDYKKVLGINYISQDENLFTDSLINNITLYKKVTLKQLNEISSLCELESIISKDRLGYEQLIEDNGFNLSGGEKQRIVLARCLLIKFNILIIDEGLNQVDIDTERKILKNLFEKYKKKTIIVISHRHNNLDLYDRKLVLEKGVLIENVSRT